MDGQGQVLLAVSSFERSIETINSQLAHASQCGFAHSITARGSSVAGSDIGRCSTTARGRRTRFEAMG